MPSKRRFPLRRSEYLSTDSDSNATNLKSRSTIPDNFLLERRARRSQPLRLLDFKW